MTKPNLLIEDSSALSTLSRVAVEFLTKHKIIDSAFSCKKAKVRSNIETATAKEKRLD